MFVSRPWFLLDTTSFQNGWGPPRSVFRKHIQITPTRASRTHSTLSILLFVVQSLSYVQLFCDAMDRSPPGSSVHGVSQARILEWIVISFLQRILLTQGLNRHLLHWQADSLPLSHKEIPSVYLLCYVQLLSYVQLFTTPWTVAHQAPLSMGILQARILEWVASPSPRDLPDPGIEPRSPALQGIRYQLSYQGSPSTYLLCTKYHGTVKISHQFRVAVNIFGKYMEV